MHGGLDPEGVRGAVASPITAVPSWPGAREAPEERQGAGPSFQCPLPLSGGHLQSGEGIEVVLKGGTSVLMLLSLSGPGSPYS